MGSFARALAKHENRFFLEIDEGLDDRMSKVKLWRAALREVANIGGMVLQKNVMPQRSLNPFVKRECFTFLSWFQDPASMNSDNKVLETDAFFQMDNLKFLELNNVRLKGHYRGFPKGLRWLCWHGFSSKYLPIDFPLESVVALEMTSSTLECIWQGNKDVTLLKILDLSHSHKLLRTPDFSRFPNLETLVLKDCISLVRVHESVGHLVRLVSLNLEGCRSLKELPRSIGNLKNLETLVISGCSSLDELPSEVKWMESLKVLKADKIWKYRLDSATHKTNFWQAPHVLGCQSQENL
nr:TMV resistance protein N-like [Ipomoea batatas]